MVSAHQESLMRIDAVHGACPALHSLIHDNLRPENAENQPHGALSNRRIVMPDSPRLVHIGATRPLFAFVAFERSQRFGSLCGLAFDGSRSWQTWWEAAFMERRPVAIKERARLKSASDPSSGWKKWGPYLSERQWGTVREDRGEHGNAWEYLSHDQSRSRAYRWGEDGIAGICDDQQILCFALALWNGADPILKERLFGLTNLEGNHGEDVKEYYFYLDSTPTHSYMKYLYKYPQRAYPYEDLVVTNRARTRTDFEYELLDTGVFDDDRYFDVVVEYAKAAPEDLLVRITATNRGAEAATLHLLPTLWFRNTWSWGTDGPRAELRQTKGPWADSVVMASHAELGQLRLWCKGSPELLFTENETNCCRVFGGVNPRPWVKDSIHDYVIHGHASAVNPAARGTKAAAHYVLLIAPGSSQEIRLRLTADLTSREPFGPEFDRTFEARVREADEFYASITPLSASDEEARVVRQALAGLLWSKQFYYYDVWSWLKDHGHDPCAPSTGRLRNTQWSHMLNADIISMPDKWEYPWYAAWDLAFHAIALDMVDPDFARQQMLLMFDQRYMHPNGQIPAYEWNFGDVNPPVHAWASWYLYRRQKERDGTSDLEFLETVFQKLLINFTWWVNRKDAEGRHVFQGGFLGLDNIGVFDRSAPLPTGGHLEQADGTAWMAFYCQSMLQIALELALHDPAKQEVAAKFYEHFLWIAAAMDRIGPQSGELWDEEDGFFYDILRSPGAQPVRLRVRSMVGLLSICASTVFPSELLDKLPEFAERVTSFTRRRPELLANIAPPGRVGQRGRHLLALLSEEKLRRVLQCMLDEKEFLSPFGIRSLSRRHLDEPYIFWIHRTAYRVDYEPGESSSGLFGGNSNWRGPIWLPFNLLLVRSLLHLHAFYGDDFLVECPTGSGVHMNLFQVAREIGTRVTRIFLRDEQGRRPVHGGAAKFQSDPHWRDLLLFYEYFHGDNGAGLGASHQTGWTAGTAVLIQLFRSLDAELLVSAGTPGISYAGLASAEPSSDAAHRAIQR
jgi:glycogen debranching enzyme